MIRDFPSLAKKKKNLQTLPVEHAFEVALDQEVFPLGEVASLDCKQVGALHKKVAFQEWDVLALPYDPVL